MLGEDFVSADSAAESLTLRTPQAKLEGRLFITSTEGDWTVVAEHDEALNLELASAIAGESSSDGFFVQPGRSGHVRLYIIVEGQRADDPAELSAAEAAAKLKDAGVPQRLIDFVASEHIAKESWQAGQHDDLILGFHAAERAIEKKTEVERALAASTGKKAPGKILSLEAFLHEAIGNARTRAIARAQLEEQLKREGFAAQLEIFDPQPEGHYCERFDAESFSFTSNGKYVWFEWHCDEACEPVTDAERAFPECSLRFDLETAEQL